MTDTMPSTPENKLLQVYQSLPTSGARAMTIFMLDGHLTLAIPQMAEDVPDQPASMQGGNSNVSMPVLRWADGRFQPWLQVPLPGGEHAEFFEIGTRSFLATVGVRSGSGPYDHNTDAIVHEWRAGAFEPIQRIPVFAGKRLCHFMVGERHFLAIAQGVTPGPGEENKPSTIYTWDGSEFVPLQTVPSTWGYNFAHFAIHGEHYLAYADHVSPSIVLHWNGSMFEPFQTMEGGSGRAFHFFKHDDVYYLAFAALLGDSILYRWSEGKWTMHQTLSGPGGREFASFMHHGELYLIMVKFLTGSRQEPKFDQESVVFKMSDGQTHIVQTFPTTGATDATYFEADGQSFVAVSQSITADIRFRNDSTIYRISA